MSEQLTKASGASAPVWTTIVPEDQWTFYREAIQIAREAAVQFVVGGAFGLAAYTGRFRNTKDLDFFVMPSEKGQLIDALTKAGFEDFYGEVAYDRGWIYRAVKNHVIVDTIWQTPNRRTQVDGEWFKRGRTVQLRGENVAAIPAEELLAIKLYILQRDRCDWPDLLNLLHAVGDRLDWEHVLRRLGPDRPLLGGVLQVFNWVSPTQAAQLPEKVRREFCLDPAPSDGASALEHRVSLLDSRPWFAAFQPEDQPMNV